MPFRFVVITLFVVTLAALPQAGAAVFAHEPCCGGSNATVRADSALVDSARVEFRIGRYWRVDRLLSQAEVLSPADSLLWARARAGYRDWSGVVELLSERPWLDTVDHGRGWLVLARGLEALDRSEASITARLHALQLDGVVTGRMRAVLHAQIAQSHWKTGEHASALSMLDLLQSETRLARWLRLEFLRGAADEGQVEMAERLAMGLMDSPVAERARALHSEALRRVGDSIAAAALWRTQGETERTSQAWVALADAARMRGDTLEALRAYRRALSVGGVSDRYSAQAARRWLDLAAPETADELLLIARTLDRSGDGAGALQAYDEYVRRTLAIDEPVDTRARVERARLMTTVTPRREAGIEEWRELSTHPDPQVGVRVLTLWRDLRVRQGDQARAATLRRWLLERYPDSEAAARLLYLRGDAAHDAGDFDGALSWYEETVRSAASQSSAGQARMRAAQLHLLRGDSARALAEYEAYLAAFSEGRRWEEAAWWSARLSLSLGDTLFARTRLERIRREAPFSYYAVLGAQLEGRSWALEGTEAPSDPAPEWLVSEMVEIDLLSEAGLQVAADAEIAALHTRARGEGAGALIQLAEQLVARRRTLEAIRVAQEARESGAPLTVRLARVLYPFPYREIVEREAAEWGLDPLLLAGLIRQESAFVHDIRSSAGAIGLMQVMPATGRELARSAGFRDFTPESLESPDVNIHLGARFLHDMLERFDFDLPLALSAYNAGPSRARRWARLPEAADPRRFTERIPFQETRGYVKNVTRNLHLYQHLWAPDSPSNRGS